MSKYVFVKLSHDYADEFDVTCCFVEEKEKFNDELEKLKEFMNGDHYDSPEFYFGTNEFLTFDDFEDFEYGVTIAECSEAFFKEFNKINPSSSVGFNVMEVLLDEASREN